MEPIFYKLCESLEEHSTEQTNKLVLQMHITVQTHDVCVLLTRELTFSGCKLPLCVLLFMANCFHVQNLQETNDSGFYSRRRRLKITHMVEG